MHNVLYDYLKQKYGQKGKSRYMDTDSFIVYINTEHIYVDIKIDFETRFDIPSYELERPIFRGENKGLTGLKKHLGREIMTTFSA